MSKLKFQLKHQEAVIATEGIRSVLQRERKKIRIQDSQEPLRQGHKNVLNLKKAKDFIRHVCV